MLVTTGCDERPTTPPRESSRTPDVDEATSQGTATTLPAQRSPAVLFAIRGGLVPLLCFDGARAASGEDGQDDGGCDAFVADGQAVAIVGAGNGSTTGTASIGPKVELGCGAESTFPARSITPEPEASAMLAVWPSDAAASIELAPESFPVSDDELAAMTKLIADEVAGRYAGPPRLTWTSGIAADVDGDAIVDRVVAAHEPSMLFGLVVFFPGATAVSGAGAPQAGSPSHVQPRVLSMMQFDRPRVIARTSIDGVPGDEIVLDSAFVEGIEDQTVTSAVSTRVVAWTDGAGTVVGSWGCRMF
jgi:hypothetical protein